jgi:WD40 repeat protein
MSKIKLKIFLLLYLFSNVTNSFSQNVAYTSIGSKDATVYDICFSKFGSWIVVPEYSVIYLYDTKTKQLLHSFENGNTKDILSVDISSDSSMIVSGGKDNLIVLWDIKNDKVISKFRYHKGVITSLKFSPNQKYLASGSSDKSMIVYDLESDSILYKCTDHTDDITSIAFSSDNNLLACSSGDNSISIIKTESWKLISTLRNHKNWVRDIKFSPDNSKLFSCGDDAKVISWNISDLNDIRSSEDIRKGFKWLLSLDVNKDNATFVTGGFDGKIRIDGPYSQYIYKIGKPIQKVLFKPNEGTNLEVAVATRGKGVLFINAKNMYMDQKIK